MADFNKVYSNTEKRIDKLLFNSKSMIRTSVRKLEEDIVSRSAAILDIGKAGNIKAQKELSQAIKFHGEIAKEFQSRYGTTVQSSSKSFLEVQSAVKSEFKGLDLPYSFGAADKDMFEALRRSAAGGLQHLGEDAMGKIAQATYSAVITGQSFGSFVKNIKDQMGSLEKYAQTRAHDSLMDYYTDLNIKKASDAGIETFLYYGNIIRASRPFCIARVGMVFTIKQIQGWDKLSWAGKRPGPTLINRGGYNCRHSLHPCEPEWIEDGRVKVQSWWDQKEKMDPKMIARVKAEEAKLKIDRAKAAAKAKPELPKFKKATSLDELNDTMVDMKLGSFTFDKKYALKDKLNIGNLLAEHADNLQKKYPTMTKVLDKQVLFNIDIHKTKGIMNRSGGSAAGMYSRQYNAIELAGSLRKIDSLGSFGKNLFAMNKDLFSTFRHELGHHLWPRMSDSRSLWAEFYKKNGKEGRGNKTSWEIQRV